MLDAAPFAQDSTIIQRLDRNGTVTDDPALASQGVTAAHRVQAFGLQVNAAGTVIEYTVIADDLGAVTGVRLFDGAAAGVNGFVVTGLTIDHAYVAEGVVATGTIAAPTPADIPALVAEMEAGNADIQIDTIAYPAGELRGQLEAF